MLSASNGFAPQRSMRGGRPFLSFMYLRKVGGFIVPPAGYFERVEEITKQHGGLFIAELRKLPGAARELLGKRQRFKEPGERLGLLRGGLRL